jgi:hypothetical protein
MGHAAMRAAVCFACAAGLLVGLFERQDMVFMFCMM